MEASEGARLLRLVERSQSQIAREVGCNRSVVWSWLRFKTKPSIRYAEKIESAYGIKASLWAKPPMQYEFEMVASEILASNDNEIGK